MSDSDARRVRLAVTEFAQPLRRKGHLRAEPGDGALKLGVEIHQRVQQRLLRDEPGYEYEVPLATRFRHGRYLFAVSGRADGVFRGLPPLIEEIKSSYRVEELRRELDEDPEHPYLLQLRVYGHMQQLSSDAGAAPRLRLRLVCSRSGAESFYPLQAEDGHFQRWLPARLQALADEEDRRRARVRRRQRLAPGLGFPFAERRPGQDRAIAAVETALQRRGELLLQAPTGAGKTAAVLYPALADSLARGAQLVFLTPKNTQFDAVAAALQALFRQPGGRPKMLVLKGREKRCLAERVHCDPRVCGFAEHYYDKLEQHQLVPKLRRKRRFDERLWRRHGSSYRVCPHALAKELIDEADLIVGDYNYVFSPHASILPRLERAGRSRRPTLLIDELHNLYERALGYYSPRLSPELLKTVETETGDYAWELRGPLCRLLADLAAWLWGLRPAGGGEARLQPAPDVLAAYAERALALLLRAMADDTALPKPLLGLYALLADMHALLAEQADGSGDDIVALIDRSGAVTVKSLDAGRRLAAAYRSFHAVIGFSATLKPFSFYRDVSGFKTDAATEELPSPFPPENRKLLVVPQISTRYRDRAAQYRRIAAVIDRVSACKPGHYFAYFPSYGFLAEMVPHLQNAERELIVQRPGQGAAGLAGIVERLRRPPACLLLAVQGGVLAEGVDFHSELLRGAFVIGPALPQVAFERRLLQAYYQRRYGDGFAYAYIYPGMARSVQAAGRVIRSPDKRAVLILLDERFARADYSRAMPGDWFEESVRERVASGMLAEIDAFWGGQGPAEDS